MNTNSIQSTVQPASYGTIIAWTVVLLFSDLPDAIWQALAGAPPTWLFLLKAGCLFAIILVGGVWKPLHSLRPFFILLLIFSVLRKASMSLGLTLDYAQRGEGRGLLLRMAQVEAARLLSAAVMVAAALVMGKRRQDLFLAKGDLTRWKRLGIILALSILVMAFFFYGYDLPSAATLLQALPLIPGALLFGALVSFDEEIRCRATLLPHLSDVVGSNQAILITTFFFSISHYFGGIPSGVEGALVTGALGWLFAIMMVQTRGVFMPWLNHFMSNVPTYLFWAIGAVSA